MNEYVEETTLNFYYFESNQRKRVKETTKYFTVKRNEKKILNKWLKVVKNP